MQNDNSHVPKNRAAELAPERIAAALSRLRPDPEAFARGVRERIALASARTDVATKETKFPSIPNAHPWLRRAAAMLPPGVLELLLVGRGTGQSIAGASATLPSTLQSAVAAPWLLAMLGLALLIALFRLGRSETRTVTSKRGASPRRTLSLLRNLIGFILVVPAGVLLFTVGVEAAVLTVLAILAGLVLFAAHALRWLGPAYPVDLAGALSSLLIQSAVWVQFFALSPTGSEFGPWSSFGMGLPLALGGLALALRMPRGQRRPGLAFGGFLVALMLVWAGAQQIIRGPHAPHQIEVLAAEAEAFEAPTEDLHAWRNFGRIADVLPRERVTELDLSLAKERLVGGSRPHPMTSLGAFRMGLLDPAAFYAQGADVLERQISGAQNSIAGSFPPERVLAAAVALERAEDPAAFGRRLAAWVDTNWPEPGAFQALEQTLGAVEILDLVETAYAQAAADVLEARRATIEAALLAAWTGRDLAPTLGLGFEVNLEARQNARPAATPDRRWARVRSGIEATYAAVLLMDRVGVPEGIDVRSLHSYLTATSRRGASATWLPDQRTAGMARAVLEERIGLEPIPIGERARHELPFLISFLVALLAHLSVPFRRASAL